MPFFEGHPVHMIGFVSSKGDVASVLPSETHVWERLPEQTIAWGRFLHEKLQCVGGYNINAVLSERGIIAMEINTRPGTPTQLAVVRQWHALDALLRTEVKLRITLREICETWDNLLEGTFVCLLKRPAHRDEHWFVPTTVQLSLRGRIFEVHDRANEWTHSAICMTGAVRLVQRCSDKSISGTNVWFGSEVLPSAIGSLFELGILDGQRDKNLWQLTQV
mmetsp:Transcript_18143/g.61726  ORF Transcript_18143/g.61726 Transcript_18143/m.61726 type:complete len:220 (-) Transcript_18143:943-1602(-)